MQRTLGVMALVLSMIGAMYARGTHSGTAIANQAQIAYAVGGIPSSLSSNTDTFVVDRIVDVQINWQDTAPVRVAAGDSDRVLTFRVTNEGNGDDNLTLGYDHNASSDFVPTGVRIVRDTNGNGRYDPGVDANVSQLTLGADANATFFLVGDIPDDNTTTAGKQSYDRLRATSESNATAGADHPGAMDVVIRKGTDVDTGTWVVRKYWLVTEKEATVHSDDNATHTGTRITYTITYYIGGNAAGKTIQNIVLTDAIPSGTRYVAGSLSQDGTARTDAADSDHADCNGTRVRLNAGTITGATRHRFEFDVRVK